MAVLRADIEQVLITRRGKLMAMVGMDVLTHDGTNASLTDCIGYATRVVGTTASVAAVNDADLLTLPNGEADADAVVDFAELRLIISIKGNLDMVDIVSGPFQEKLSQLGLALDRDIKYLTDYVYQNYDVGPINVQGGVVRLNIGSHIFDEWPTQALP